jgi:hypothetical protein
MPDTSHYNARRGARAIVAKLGYVDALATARRLRDKSSPGTCTFAIWNATVRELELGATVGHLCAAQSKL